MITFKYLICMFSISQIFSACASSHAPYRGSHKIGVSGSVKLTGSADTFSVLIAAREPSDLMLLNGGKIELEVNGKKSVFTVSSEIQPTTWLRSKGISTSYIIASQGADGKRAFRLQKLKEGDTVKIQSYLPGKFAIWIVYAGYGKEPDIHKN